MRKYLENQPRFGLATECCTCGKSLRSANILKPTIYVMPYYWDFFQYYSISWLDGFLWNYGDICGNLIIRYSVLLWFRDIRYWNLRDIAPVLFLPTCIHCPALSRVLGKSLQRILVKTSHVQNVQATNYVIILRKIIIAIIVILWFPFQSNYEAMNRLVTTLREHIGRIVLGKDCPQSNRSFDPKHRVVANYCRCIPYLQDEKNVHRI